MVGYSTQIGNDAFGDDGIEHSPIIGWAYDGNPIYGPYGYSNPSNSFKSMCQIFDESVVKFKDRNVLGSRVGDEFQWITYETLGEEVQKFRNVLNVKYEENIRGCDVFIIQSTNGPSENIMELALLVDASVRASADTVTVVIPYFGYGRQDRKDQPRVPISSRVIVDILTALGTNRIITLDLHSTQIQGFANIPFDNLYSRTVLYDAIKEEAFNPEETVVLALVTALATAVVLAIVTVSYTHLTLPTSDLV